MNQLSTYARIAATCASLGIMATARSLADSLHTISICEIANHPADFDNRKIRVAGSLLSDGVENEGIVDKSCPRRGIGVQYSDAGVNNPSVQKLREAILSPPRLGTDENKIISVTLIGTFRWQLKGDVRLRWIEVDDASNLKLTVKSAQ